MGAMLQAIFANVLFALCIAAGALVGLLIYPFIWIYVRVWEFFRGRDYIDKKKQ